MTYYALIYHVVDDYQNRRTAFRIEHLRIANDAVKRGELLYGGAYTDPVDQAMVIFRVKDKSVVETFAKNDPYVINGLVERWEIREWNVVVGGNV